MTHPPSSVPLMSQGLRVPMADRPVWANVMRPRSRLVYLDLFSIIFMARAIKGDSRVPMGYDGLYAACLDAKRERRAIFPLSDSHIWEIHQITDPAQRADVCDVFEALSDYQYLLGRASIAELEIRAGVADILGESNSSQQFALLRPTMGQAFGYVGGLRILDANGADASAAVREQIGDAEYEQRMAELNYLFERSVLEDRPTTNSQSSGRIRLTGPRRRSPVIKAALVGNSKPSAS